MAEMHVLSVVWLTGDSDATLDVFCWLRCWRGAHWPFLPVERCLVGLSRTPDLFGGCVLSRGEGKLCDAGLIPGKLGMEERLAG